MFQSLLAKRYIVSNRRHSILTICSIIAALTLMTMLFTGFSTVLKCLRAYELEVAPYHFYFYHVTEEQGEIISKIDYVKSCELKPNTETDDYAAYVFLKSSVEDELDALDRMILIAGLDLESYEFTERFEGNNALMMYDYVGESARFQVAQIFALFYIFVIFLAMFMRLVIDTAFEISSKERERQFGVLQSIGATPKQVVGIITMEGLYLSVVGIPIGLLCGVGLAWAALQSVRVSGIAEGFSIEHPETVLQFGVSPWLLLVSAVTGLVWVLLSAYGTGMRIIKMSPVQAIQNRSNKVRKVHRFTILGLFFGWKGKLASRNTHRTPKRFAITVLSLTLSIALFSSFTFAIDAFEEGMHEVFASEGMDFDFLVTQPSTSKDVKPVPHMTHQDSVREMEESGCFEDIRVWTSAYGEYQLTEDSHVSVSLDFINEVRYNEFFGENPPMRYDELEASGGYIMLTMDEETARQYIYGTPQYEAWVTASSLYGKTSLDVSVLTFDTVTLEEYEQLSEEERVSLWDESINLEDGSLAISHYVQRDYSDMVCPIVTACDVSNAEGLYDIEPTCCQLIAPLSLYEKNAAFFSETSRRFSIGCDLTDADHHKTALAFFAKHNYLELGADLYEQNASLHASLALTKLICAFIMCVIAVIAIVNMINIISTGILNRREELTAMQHIGMTERQMYGMTFIECLQYALFSGVGASLLCMGLMYGTMQFLKLMTLDADFSDVINYFAPLPTVWLCAGAALLVAVLTALLSLHGMKGTSLIEQLRRVD